MTHAPQALVVSLIHNDYHTPGQHAQLSCARSFLPGGIRSLFLTDWALEPGLRLRSSSSSTPLAVSEGAGAAGVSADSGSGGKRGPLCFVTLRKQPQVLWRRGVWDCWLTGKVDLELARGSDEATTRASARLKVVRLNVTDKQDLLLALGADWQQTQGATGELVRHNQHRCYCSQVHMAAV
jgi:hypothetical protein